MSNEHEDPNEKLKQELREKIGKVEALKGELEDEKEKIRGAYQTIQDEVATPIEFPTYDLSEDNKWRGMNYDKACEDLAEIITRLNSYQTNVSEVMGQIDTAISRLQEVIDDLNAQLAALG